MENQVPFTPDPAQVALIQKKLSLENRFRSGVGWFNWIAGLSILNSVIFYFGASITFVTGLGITQFVDGFIAALIEDLGSAYNYVRVIGFVINLLFAGVFIILGVLGRKRKRWPIILGLVVYTLDMILLLFFKDWFGMIFHALALIGIWGALKVMKELETLESSVLAPAPAVIPSNVVLQPQQAPVTLPQPVPSPEEQQASKKKFKIFLIVLGVLFIVPFCIFLIGVLTYKFN